MNRSLLDDLPEPPLFGEEWVTALLLKMVVEHCATGKPYDLSSHGIAANEDAMHELNGAEIEITHETAQCIFANVTPEGRALLEKLRAELEADEQRRTGADLIEALQASPRRDIEIEPERTKPPQNVTLLTACPDAAAGHGASRTAA